MKRSGSIAAFLAVCGMFAGCGPGGPKLPEVVSVTGEVLYNQKPVEGAEVIFVSSAPDAKPARGITDAQGRFKLKTYVDAQHDLDGATPGDYQVSVSKIDAPAAKMTGEEMSKMMGSGQAIPMPKDLLPAKYKDAKSSGLTKSVKAKEKNDFKLELMD